MGTFAEQHPHFRRQSKTQRVVLWTLVGILTLAALAIVVWLLRIGAPLATSRESDAPQSTSDEGEVRSIERHVPRREVEPAPAPPPATELESSSVALPGVSGSAMPMREPARRSR